MTKEQKKRPAVFISAEDTTSENIDDILSAAPSPEEKKETQEKSFGEWTLITEAQHTGQQFLVASEVNEEGTRAFWRKTRVLKHCRWETHGKWTDALTHRDVLPQPIYFKEIVHG